MPTCEDTNSPSSQESEIAKVIPTLPSEEELEAKCLELGLIMRRPPKFDITHPAITLFPSVIQADVLYELYAKQVLWNEAIDRTARNYAFLRESLRETAASDVTFTGKLIDMLERVYMLPPVLPGAAKVTINHPVFQPLMLGIFRSDYMRSMDGVPPQKPGKPRPKETAAQWKNVEINTVSCSFAALSTLVGKFHNYLQKYRNILLTGRSDADVARTSAKGQGEKSEEGRKAKSTDESASASVVERSISLNAIPEALADAAEAWKASVPFQEFVAHYRKLGKRKETKQDPEVAEAFANLVGDDMVTIPVQPVVLVVIQEDERNTGDQYKLLFTLLKQHGVVSIRRTMAQLHDSMELVYFNGGGGDGADGTRKTSVSGSSASSPLSSATHKTGKYSVPPFAVVEKKYVAAVVYFRSTYVPQDFPTAAVWESRERLERCNGIKCPSLPYHLMTLKKMQQLLSLVPSVLVPVAFNGNEEKAKSLALHFMEQYSLNKEEYKKGDSGADADADPETYIRAAIANPTEYVLKPQLEGGGNLIAGEEMVELLRTNAHACDPYYSKIRKEYILMKKIHYERKDGLLFRQGQMFTFANNACSELGIFGCILSDGTEETFKAENSNVADIGKGAKTATHHKGVGATTAVAAAGAHAHKRARVFNRYGGYNMRTKPADVEDGGVMAGVACLDNVRLV